MYALDLQRKDWRLMSPKKKLAMANHMANLPDSVDGFTVTDPDEMMDKYLTVFLKYHRSSDFSDNNLENPEMILIFSDIVSQVSRQKWEFTEFFMNTPIM
ncbi:hypothetical protein DPMN_085031 [Dreissena polymorpha]|uniref:Uncharacterized protein n=1 Tax=Dreissena polymorpha TaxID=45954 RepID=A0A9D3YFB7_DREPO|nr:hypothetical protein DPMN_085031 [Dreissena polymorpha]